MNHDDTRKNYLVATNLPPGKALYQNSGCSDNEQSLLNFARRCGNCPKEIEAVSAVSVGIEWHCEGVKLEGWERYREGKYVILQNVIGMARRGEAEI